MIDLKEIYCLIFEMYHTFLGFAFVMLETEFRTFLRSGEDSKAELHLQPRNKVKLYPFCNLQIRRLDLLRDRWENSKLCFNSQQMCAVFSNIRTKAAEQRSGT